MNRIIFVAALALFLAGCAGANPPQEAYGLNKEYQAVAQVAYGYVSSPIASPVAKCAVKAGDNIAFNYVQQITKQAQDWNNAADADKEKELTVFERLMALGTSALNNFSSIMNLVQTGQSVSCQGA